MSANIDTSLSQERERKDAWMRVRGLDAASLKFTESSAIDLVRRAHFAKMTAPPRTVQRTSAKCLTERAGSPSSTTRSASMPGARRPRR